MAKYQNDIRKAWKVLNNITGLARKRKSLSDTFLVNGEKCTDKVKIANEFCSFFTDIGKQYAEAIPKPLNTPESYLGNAPNPSTMYFTPTGPNEVIKIIQSFKIDAIIDFTADVLPSLDKREQCIAAYLDLSKAFDMINHGILLKKLECYGIRGRSWSGLKVIYTREGNMWNTKVCNLKLKNLNMAYLRDRCLDLLCS